jgi:hypothetical protein
MAKPGPDDNVQETVTVAGIRQDPDRHSPFGFRTPAGSLHDPAKSAAAQDFMVECNERTDRLCSFRFLAAAVPGPDNGNLNRHGLMHPRSGNR